MAATLGPGLRRPHCLHPDGETPLRTRLGDKPSCGGVRHRGALVTFSLPHYLLF